MPAKKLTNPNPEFLVWEGFIDIEEAVPLPGNPKTHVSAMLQDLLAKYGFIRRPLINSINLHIIAGNGRIEELLKLKNAGKPAPKGVGVNTEGKWLIPCDYIELPIEEEMAVALADNRATELGQWDQEKLSKALAGITPDNAKIAGFEKDLVVALNSLYQESENDPDDWDEEIAQAVAMPSVPTKSTTPGSIPRKDLSRMVYVVRTETLAKFRKAIREIMKSSEITDISDAMEILMDKAWKYDDLS